MPRRGYTLLEMLLGAGAAALLMAGLSSALLLAGRALDHGGARAVETRRAHEVCDDLARDLDRALSFSERGPRAVTCTVPDRDGDDVPETLRYWWSGTAGEPLQVSYNGGAAARVADDVRAFQLNYATRPMSGAGFCKGMIFDPACVAWWTCDETTGTTAADATANQNHGALANGPLWTAGTRGGGLNFDGTNDYVLVPHQAPLSITNQLTLAAWIWAPSGALSGFRVILVKGTGANVVNYALATYGTDLAFGFYNGYLNGTMTAGLNLQAQRWYHVAATWQPEGTARRMTIYVDGVARATATTTVPLVANSQGLYLGREYSGSYWRGVLDDVRIYNRALSAAEILEIKNGTL